MKEKELKLRAEPYKKVRDLIEKTKSRISNNAKYHYLNRFFNKNKSIYLFWENLTLFLGRIEIKPIPNFEYNYLTNEAIRKYVTGSRISQKINVLCYLGLIDKLNTKDKEYSSIPIVRNTRAKNINFLAIPKINLTTLQQAEVRAKKLLDNKFSLKSFNKSFLIEIEGYEEANIIIQNDKDINVYRKKQRKQIRKYILENVNLSEYVAKKVLREKVVNYFYDKYKNKIEKKNNIEYLYETELEKLKKENFIEIRKLNKEEKIKLSQLKNNLLIYIIRKER